MQTTIDDERELDLAQQREESPGRQMRRHEESRDGMAKTLGWLSIGLGLAEVAAPRQLSRLIGVQERPNLLRLLGIREIASGLGILMQDRRAPWLWSRVAGDAIDLTLLGIALASSDSDRSRLGVATAAIVGVTALDLFSSAHHTAASEPVQIRKVQEDLPRLKQVMETGEIPTTAGQPSGPSKTAILSSLFRAAERQRR